MILCEIPTHLPPLSMLSYKIKKRDGKLGKLITLKSLYITFLQKQEHLTQLQTKVNHKHDISQ
jgi:hypothetical protein